LNSSSKTYDLISLGEPLLRLSPRPGVPLRKADALELQVAGSQLNLAANLAQLGWRTAFLTKLPDNPLGWRTLDACRTYGVNVDHVSLVPGAKMGVTYVEFSAEPRAAEIVYDRARSAASTIAPADFDWADLARQTRLAYTDGLFPGLSASCRESTEVLVSAAKQAGTTTAFDMNYREHLWTAPEARDCWLRLLPKIDVLVSNRNVSEQVLGYGGSDEDLLKRYAGEFGCELVCLTYRETLSSRRGAFRSVALSGGNLGGGKLLEGVRREFDIVDRYGTGDAWLAGLLFGLDCQGAQHGLDFAGAMIALAHTVFGDVPFVTKKQVESVLSGHSGLDLRR
jgi:2-dehydro-3-deoxygluconokinase